MQAIERIEKDKHNEKQGYDYASEKVIKEAVHKELVNQRVIFQFETANPRIQEWTFSQHEKEVHGAITLIDCKYAFHDVDSGESLHGTFTGSGSGRDDKGHYAAITGAIKYIMTSTFLIPTGDDPENDEPPKARAGTPKQYTPEATTEQPGLTGTCAIHNAPLKEGISKQTGNPYWYHIDPNGKFCFGGKK